MAGLPGGGRGPGGVPKFVSAPATKPVGQQPDTTHILRAPTFVPTWRNWVPPGGIYGFIDYSIGFSAVTVDTTHILRAPTFTPTWQPWRLENRGFVQSVPLTLAPVPAVPTFMPGVIVWSNPRAAQQSVDLLTWTQSLSAPDLLPPFAQDDWPNPVRPRPVIVTDWIADTNLGLLRPDVRPFAQDDWPNPRAPLRGQDFGASTNLGLLRPDVAPFSQDDWPNPRGAQRGQDFVASTNLGLLRPDVNPFIPHDWANLRLVLAPVSDWLQQGIRAAVVVQAPFAQFAWPNPQVSLQRQDFVAGTNLGLLRPDVNPFVPHDWANPRLALRPITDWAQAAIRSVVQVQAPFAQDDWPNPVRAVDRGQYQKWTDYYSIQVIPFASQGGNWDNPRGPFDWRAYQGLIDYSMQPAAVVTPPDTTHILRAPVYTPRWQPYLTVNFDWSQSVTALNLPPTIVTPPDTTHILRAPFYTPRWEPRRSVNLYTLVNGVVGTGGVVPPAAPPFLPLDWPNPIRLADRGQYQKWSDYYSIQIIPPPTNYDQPNPRWPQPNRADWIQGTTLTLRPVGVVQAPLRPIDWPNPRAAVRGPADHIASTNLGVLRPGVNPEINYDWPNPQAARRAVADWIQSAFAALATAPPPPTPFAQTDWPNPRGAVGVHVGFAAGTNQGLLRPELNPFAQRDWQNPRGAVGSHVGFAAATQLNLLRPDVNPFLPRDLPNPRAPLRSIDLYGWVQALSALVFPPPVFPPIGQYNWPNPAGPQRGIDLFGWSQSPTALTLPETIIPPPEVLQPGGRAVPHTFSRKKWRELQMLIAAEMAAVAKAEELTKRGKREALLQAARAAAAAVDAAEAEGENKRLDKLLVRNALTLRAATRAASEVKLLRETASAIEQSRAIVQRQQDEEDEMINLLMLS